MTQLGLGTWAIGGPWTAGGAPAGWGQTDDGTSRAAIALAVEAGIRFFDTAQTYGTGHAESLLGEALAPHPEVRIATKVGYAIDPAARELVGPMTDPIAIAASLEASRRRLRRDRIDLVLLHLNALPVAEAAPVFDLLEGQRAKGQVAAYGWSTDFPDRATAFAGREGFTAVEHAMNVFFRADALIPVIEGAGLQSLNRSPLAMGLLGGRIAQGHRFAPNDVRRSGADWLAYFTHGEIAPDYARMLNAVRELLTTGGRSLAQGAICWLWARSAAAMPLPGFRTPDQVADLCGALAHGPLPADTMAEIEAVIARPPDGPPRER